MQRSTDKNFMLIHVSTRSTRRKIDCERGISKSLNKNDQKVLCKSIQNFLSNHNSTHETTPFADQRKRRNEQSREQMSKKREQLRKPENKNQREAFLLKQRQYFREYRQKMRKNKEWHENYKQKDNARRMEQRKRARIMKILEKAKQNAISD